MLIALKANKVTFQCNQFSQLMLEHEQRLAHELIINHSNPGPFWVLATHSHTQQLTPVKSFVQRVENRAESETLLKINLKFHETAYHAFFLKLPPNKLYTIQLMLILLSVLSDVYFLNY